MTQVFTGRQISIYAATVLRQGLLLYAKTRQKPNTQWTPTNMLATATRYTGVKYRRGQYAKAAADLAIVIELLKESRPNA